MNDRSFEVDEHDGLAGFKIDLDPIAGEVAEAAAVEHAGLVGLPLDDPHRVSLADPDAVGNGLADHLRMRPMAGSTIEGCSGGHWLGGVFRRSEWRTPR